MDLNINLREDKFLFPDENNNNGKNNGSGLIVAALNKRGIFTINDLINYDQTKFSSNSAHYLRALIQILRYKYLGEELINDVLLESDYTNSAKDHKKLARDLKMLGFGRGSMPKEVYNIVVSFMQRQPDRTIITMEQVLKSDSPVLRKLELIGNADFRGFYLEYLEQKRRKNQQEILEPTKEVLESLKNQLCRLITERDELDKKINDLQDKINALDGGQEVHGK